MLSDILEETIGYRELCQALLQMHEDILVPLKEREDQARSIIKELKHLQREFERKRKELEEKAGSERSWVEASTRLYQKLGPISKPSHPREQTRTTSTGGWKSRRKPFKKNILF